MKRRHQGGQQIVLIVQSMQREAELLEIVFALHAAHGLTCRLHSRKQQHNQHSDNRDDDQQFDEREGGSSTCSVHARNHWPGNMAGVRKDFRLAGQFVALLGFRYGNRELIVLGLHYKRFFESMRLLAGFPLGIDW